MVPLSSPFLKIRWTHQPWLRKLHLVMYSMLGLHLNSVCGLEVCSSQIRNYLQKTDPGFLLPSALLPSLLKLWLKAFFYGIRMISMIFQMVGKITIRIILCDTWKLHKIQFWCLYIQFCWNTAMLTHLCIVLLSCYKGRDLMVHKPKIFTV